MSLTAEQVEATATKYVVSLTEGDLDAVMSIYSDNPRVEDPAGGDSVFEGYEAVKGFYESVTSLDCELELHETRACGNELLFHFTITTHFDENSKATIDVWDYMLHDDEGKVELMKAFWTPANMS